MMTLSGLNERMSINDIKLLADEIEHSPTLRQQVLECISDDNRVKTVNALWALTHAGENCRKWLQRYQEKLIDNLLIEKNKSKKRLYLQILRRQVFVSDSPKVIELLDYCMPKINAEDEPYAVRCFSLYVAFEICKDYPELLSELQLRMELLSLQSLSPGLKSGLRQVNQKIRKLRNRREKN